MEATPAMALVQRDFHSFQSIRRLWRACSCQFQKMRQIAELLASPFSPSIRQLLIFVHSSIELVRLSQPTGRQ
jgi:hypothetical protein